MRMVPLIFLIFFSAVPISAWAAPSEGALVKAMHKLGSIWKELAQGKEVILSRCAENTFMAKKLEQGSQVSIDLKKTDSLLNPYLGIVRIEGRFITNARSPHANGFKSASVLQPGTACFRTTTEAIKSLDQTDFANDLSYRFAFEIYYVVDNNALVLNDGNKYFKNAFLSGLAPEYLKPGSLWIKVFKMPIDE